MTLLLAAVLGMNRLFVTEREQGGFDAFLLAPVDRTAMFVAKATVLFGFLVVVEIVAVLAFALLLLGPGLGQALPELPLVLLLADVGLAVIGTLVGALGGPDPRARPDRPPAGAPAVHPAADRGGAGHRATVRRQAARRRSRGAGWLILALYDVVFGLLAYAVFDFLLED